jgi:hypothetical protein
LTIKRMEVGAVNAIADVLGVSLDWLVLGKSPTPVHDELVASVARAKARWFASTKPCAAAPGAP